MRLIDEDHVLKVLKMCKKREVFVANVIEFIEDEPTVEAVPVRRGRWKVKYGVNVYDGVICTCSECGYELVASPQALEHMCYCANCGAKMECMETDDAEN